MGGLYVVNTLYSFSCEINTNYACGCINLRGCIDLRGEDSRINYFQGLKVLSQPLLRFSLPREVGRRTIRCAQWPVLPVGYVVSASWIADRRMILVGYRLAGLLSRIMIN